MLEITNDNIEDFRAEIKFVLQQLLESLVLLAIPLLAIDKSNDPFTTSLILYSNTLKRSYHLRGKPY